MNFITVPFGFKLLEEFLIWTSFSIISQYKFLGGISMPITSQSTADHWTSMPTISRSKTQFLTSMPIINQSKPYFWTSMPIISQSKGYFLDLNAHNQWMYCLLLDLNAHNQSIYSLLLDLNAHMFSEKVHIWTSKLSWYDFKKDAHLKNATIWRRFRAEISHMRPIQGPKLRLFQRRISGVLCIGIRHRKIFFIKINLLQKAFCE